MIHLYLNLFFEDYDAINQQYKKQIHFLSVFFLILLDIFAKETQKFFNYLIYFIAHHNFYTMAICKHSTNFIRFFRTYKINYHF